MLQTTICQQFFDSYCSRMSHRSMITSLERKVEKQNGDGLPSLVDREANGRRELGRLSPFQERSKFQNKGALGRIAGDLVSRNVQDDVQDEASASDENRCHHEISPFPWGSLEKVPCRDQPFDSSMSSSRRQVSHWSMIRGSRELSAIGRWCHRRTFCPPALLLANLVPIGIVTVVHCLRWR